MIINQFFKRIYHIGIDSEEIKKKYVTELPTKLRGYLSERTMEIYPGELLSSMHLWEKVHTQKRYLRREQEEHVNRRSKCLIFSCFLVILSRCYS